VVQNANKGVENKDELVTAKRVPVTRHRNGDKSQEIGMAGTYHQNGWSPHG
jgi:hypothetical protein